MRIEKCWYCSCNVYPGHGVMFVRNDCKQFRFCSGKCHAHFKMKHNPKKLKWTKASRKYRGKEMVLDTTFEFEQRRCVPVRYDRNLWIKTIQAMKRVAETRQVRKVRFHKQRLAAQVKKRMAPAQKELKKHKDLVKSINLAPSVFNMNKPIVKKMKSAAVQKVNHMEVS